MIVISSLIVRFPSHGGTTFTGTFGSLYAGSIGPNMVANFTYHVPPKSNMTMENPPWMKMYFLLKMSFFRGVSVLPFWDALATVSIPAVYRGHGGRFHVTLQQFRRYEVNQHGNIQWVAWVFEPFNEAAMEIVELFRTPEGDVGLNMGWTIPEVSDNGCSQGLHDNASFGMFGYGAGLGW